MNEMNEILEIEFAAKEYIEHHTALNKSEEKLQTYIKQNGADATKTIVDQIDFPKTDWQRIVMGVNPSKNSSIPEGMEALIIIFYKLERMSKLRDSDETTVKNLLGQANENIDETLLSTKEKLASLSKQLEKEGNESKTIGGKGGKMDREELLSSIAEVAQELMQPLTCINASLEMILGGYVGKLDKDQHEMLTIASNSGENLKFLMNELIKIVGFPSNRGVDRRFALPQHN